ncbi:MAG: 30S ribosomal protein S19 [Candidatus Harrisonbacteria bacterium]|nr:30S ribosomal protein S19 [Candidatus Harrisonbacteria bacterium]
MSRSSKKGPYVDQKLIKKLSKISPSDKTVINTWARASEISPEMVGFTLGIHNGRKHIPVKIREEMVGHRLGEFSPTRTFSKHGGKIQKELEQKAALAAKTASQAAKTEGKK